MVWALVAGVASDLAEDAAAGAAAWALVGEEGARSLRSCGAAVVEARIRVTVARHESHAARRAAAADSAIRLAGASVVIRAGRSPVRGPYGGVGGGGRFGTLHSWAAAPVGCVAVVDDCAAFPGVDLIAEAVAFDAQDAAEADVRAWAPFSFSLRLVGGAS